MFDSLNKKNVYYSSLLHDIGKFIERSRLFKEHTQIYENDFGVSRKYAHRLYSALFADQFKSKTFLSDGSILKSVLFHHGSDEISKNFLDTDVQTKIIRIADDLASGERQEKTNQEEDDKKDYLRVKLSSVFSEIALSKNNLNNIKKYYEINPLELKDEIVFPQSEENQSEENSYPDAVKKFFEEFQEFGDDKNLLFYLEKFIWCVPSETYSSSPNISLYDHLRVTAAIANCLAVEYYNNKYFRKNLFNYQQIKKENNYVIEPKELSEENLFLLIQADFSGIQNFIFDITISAAKSLKARSFYLQILSEVICKYLIDKLELEETNVIYNGGGNFYLLIPYSLKNNFYECKKYISEILLKVHNGDIYLALGELPMKMVDFKNFGEQWKKSSEIISKLKNKKFEELNYDNLFEPFSVPYNKKEDSDFYKSFNNFSDKIKKAKFIGIKRINPEVKKEFTNCEDVFKAFGYNISFYENEKNFNDKENIFKLNDTNFSNLSGFKFIVNKIDIADFTEISEKAKGTKKLGLLKLDVDNLGLIFQRGLNERERSISRIATLSRNFKLFFEGYINKIIDEEKFLDKDTKERLIYVIYSGGDDTMLIGPYDKVIELVLLINQKFREFVSNNSEITLSASLTIIDDKFPLLYAAQIAEENLTKAKHKDEKKNKIAVFGEVFTWDEFNKVIKIKNLLYDLIENKKEKESRAILQKIYNSTRGFKHLLENSNKGILQIEKIWRFRYYLRNMKTENEKERDYLIKIYEEILTQNFIDKDKIKNPMIIPVACRIAEFLTKK